MMDVSGRDSGMPIPTATLDNKAKAMPLSWNARILSSFWIW
jgi:hypothetical protein